MRASYRELLEKGSIAFELQKEITLKNLRHYAWASGDYNPIHYEKKVAQKMGLQSPIAHGMYCMGLLQRALSEVFYDSNYEIYDWENRFVAMVPVNSSLRFEARVVTKQEKELKLEVLALLENDEKNIVLKSKVYLKETA